MKIFHTFRTEDFISTAFWREWRKRSLGSQSDKKKADHRMFRSAFIVLTTQSMLLHRIRYTQIGQFVIA